MRDFSVFFHSVYVMFRIAGSGCENMCTLQLTSQLLTQTIRSRMFDWIIKLVVHFCFYHLCNLNHMFALWEYCFIIDSIRSWIFPFSATQSIYNYNTLFDLLRDYNRIYCNFVKIMCFEIRNLHFKCVIFELF